MAILKLHPIVLLVSVPQQDLAPAFVAGSADAEASEAGSEGIEAGLVVGVALGTKGVEDLVGEVATRELHRQMPPVDLEEDLGAMADMEAEWLMATPAVIDAMASAEIGAEIEAEAEAGTVDHDTVTETEEEPLAAIVSPCLEEIEVTELTGTVTATGIETETEATEADEMMITQENGITMEMATMTHGANGDTSRPAIQRFVGGYLRRHCVLRSYCDPFYSPFRVSKGIARLCLKAPGSPNFWTQCCRLVL